MATGIAYYLSPIPLTLLMCTITIDNTHPLPLARNCQRSTCRRNSSLSLLCPAHRPERLREIFSAFGFISTIYYPVDLRSRRTRDFALVRFIEEKDAREAQRRLDGQDVGRYGPTRVRVSPGR